MKRLIVLGMLVIILRHLTDSAPICHSCNNDCYQNMNSTNSGMNSTHNLIDELELSTHRQKRETDVEYRACSHLQVELLLIPLAIAMIPIILCALIACTCFCGPKESRGKLPDDFLSSFPMSKKRCKMNSEEMELEFRDGYVQHKDSTRTKFSTVVSYIEDRRESLSSLRTDGGTPTNCTEPRIEVAQEQMTTPVTINVDQLHKTPSVESMKRTRFSDTISVISAESFLRR